MSHWRTDFRENGKSLTVSAGGGAAGGIAVAVMDRLGFVAGTVPLFVLVAILVLSIAAAITAIERNIEPTGGSDLDRVVILRGRQPLDESYRVIRGPSAEGVIWVEPQDGDTSVE